MAEALSNPKLCICEEKHQNVEMSDSTICEKELRRLAHQGSIHNHTAVKLFSRYKKLERGTMPSVLCSILPPLSYLERCQNLGIVPHIQNIVCTVNLCCPLDLKYIAQHARNSEYNPRRLCALVMRVREPRTTALLFASGRLVVTGARAESQCREAARKYARIVQRLGHPAARFAHFALHNMVASCEMGHSIRLEGLALLHARAVSYEPELFPGLVYRMAHPRVLMLVFVSGKVVVTGAKCREQLYQAFYNIYPILKSFRKL